MLKYSFAQKGDCAGVLGQPGCLHLNTSLLLAPVKLTELTQLWKKLMGSLPSGETSVTCALPCQGIAEHSGASSDDVPRRGIHLHCRTQRETRHVIENCGFGSSGWICPCIHVSICSYAFLVAHGPAEVHFVSPGNHETFHIGAARTSSVNLPLLALIWPSATSGWSCVGSSALRCPLHFHL